MAETTAIDYETLIYTKIWDLLLARQKFTDAVPAGNRIRYDNIEGLNVAEKENPTDADYYEAILYVSGGEDSMLTEGVVFNTYSDDGPSQWTEELVFTYKLLLTSPWVGVAKIDLLAAEARTAIRRGKNNLGGLTYVKAVKISWKTEREIRGNPENLQDATARWTTDMEIRVECEVEGATLLGE